MSTNKKVSFYLLIVFFLASAGLLYVSIVKGAWKQKNIKTAKASEIAESKVASKPAEATPADTSLSEPSPEEITEPQKDSIAVTKTENLEITSPEASAYPLHKNISTTYFWAGEEADKDNKNISNLPSAWDEDWVKHFGCIDDPTKRNGFYPASATPKENPFYFALPYNDFDSDGNPKKDAQALAMWGQDQKFGAEQSMCKNQWIRIIKGDKVAYAQWEDVGPFGEDDKAYVFGGSQPKSKENEHAGLDVSPAVHDYLGLGDMDKTDWQFVDAKDVPDGPWKKIITTSQVYWK